MKITGKYTAVLLSISFLAFLAGTNVGFAATATYDSTDVPKATVDNGTVTSTLAVPALACDDRITDVNVQININHDFLDALDIFLIAPDGTEVELTTDNGGGPGSYTDTIFDDEVATLITAGVSPFTGSFQPEGLLSALDGKFSQGTWTLRVTDDDGLGDIGIINSWSLTVTTFDGTGTILSQDIPKAIPDGPAGQVTSAIAMPICVSQTIQDVNVTLDITHTWDGDLDIFLIAPNGTRVELTTDNGGSNDHYTDTTFDDFATTAIIDGTAPFTGSFIPEGSLSDLNDMSTAGTWTLEITDDEAIAAGTLNSWSLTFGQTPGKTFASNLPVTPAAITSDPVTGNLYIVNAVMTPLTLHQIAPDGTVTQISADCTDDGGGAGSLGSFSYLNSDIQFLNGQVYIPLSLFVPNPNLQVIACDASTGTPVLSRSITGITGLMDESGMATDGSQLFISQGDNPAAGLIYSYTPGSGTDSLYYTATPPISVRSIEHVKGSTYFSSWNGVDYNYYKADLASGGYTPLFGGASLPVEDFFVLPDNKNAVIANNTTAGVAGLYDDFAHTILTIGINATRHDMTFTKSSTDSGCSVYIVDGTRIVEFSGFKCTGGFPWPMFLPAITNTAP